MSEEAQSSSEEGFDLERLKDLIALMDEHGLTEIDLRRGDRRWRLRRGPQETLQMVPANPTAVAESPSPAAPPSDASVTETTPTVEITSPTVGTFYSAPTPEEPQFVEVGSGVSAETVVCIVEAMKVFNQIAAEVSGTIIEILVANGDPVEYGQALFRVRPG